MSDMKEWRQKIKLIQIGCHLQKEQLITTLRVHLQIMMMMIIIIIISLFNVAAKNKVKNYNEKEIIVYIINYNIQNGSTWLIYVNIPNDGHLLTQC